MMPWYVGEDGPLAIFIRVVAGGPLLATPRGYEWLNDGNGNPVAPDWWRLL
jgi:hypothetical protein